MQISEVKNKATSIWRSAIKATRLWETLEKLLSSLQEQQHWTRRGMIL